jgi:hypothetical protein
MSSHAEGDHCHVCCHQAGGLREAIEELKKQIGGIKPFPNASIDGFLSHFVFMVEFLRGPQQGQYATVTMPIAVQSVSRSSPFVYKGTDANHAVSIPLPGRSKLPTVIRESDFFIRPNGFFEVGSEVVWMQIINLDARAKTEIGHLRVILGETVQNEYPKFFKPSLGAAESLGKTGFPARLFFNPVAILETEFGVFRAVHGVLTYGRITDFPPIGASVSITDTIPMEPLEQILERRDGKRQRIDPPVRIIALAHPIDVPMQISGYDSIGAITQQVQNAPKIPQTSSLPGSTAPKQPTRKKDDDK